jgi:hypothetical protein
VPEIDFTLHTMEDGSQVSTEERVCKGTSQMIWAGEFFPLILPCRRPSTRINPADGRPVLFSSGSQQA